MKKHLLLSMIVLLSMIPFTASGQKNTKWQNPAERYAQAYKQYENAVFPIPADSIHEYVYFACDRDAVRNHPMLSMPRFAGAQIMYPWKELEPEKGRYDFSAVRDDYTYLRRHGKKLFVQLQDTTFSTKRIAVPDYLRSPEYDGGVMYQRDDDSIPEGWAAKRWNPAVQKRFALLLNALGNSFDGKIAGINLQESCIGVSEKYDKSFSPEVYVQALKTNMLSLKKAFPKSVTMQYANFMPGEWLPWEDHGYLRAVYEYGEKIGVGLGGPDLMVRRKEQLNHTIAMMHEGSFTVPLGIAVQDGNYIGQTGSDKEYDEYTDSGHAGHKNNVPMLHAFAKDFMNVSYIFWSNQQPYFTEDVIPCFSGSN